MKVLQYNVSLIVSFQLLNAEFLPPDALRPGAVCDNSVCRCEYSFVRHTIIL